MLRSLVPFLKIIFLIRADHVVPEEGSPGLMIVAPSRNQQSLPELAHSWASTAS